MDVDEFHEIFERLFFKTRLCPPENTYVYAIIWENLGTVLSWATRFTGKDQPYFHAAQVVSLYCIYMGPTLLTWINFNPSTDEQLHILYDEITYPFPNFNGCTVEVWVIQSDALLDMWLLIHARI